jgi:hypothetical protein
MILENIVFLWTSMARELKGFLEFVARCFEYRAKWALIGY